MNKIKFLNLTTDYINLFSNSRDMSWSKLRGIVKGGEAWCATVHWGRRVRHDWETEQIQWINNTLEFGEDEQA